MNETNLATICILLIYVFFGTSCIFSAAITNKFKAKWILFLSGLGYTAFISSGILISICISSEHFICSSVIKKASAIVMASMCGISAATLWVEIFNITFYHLRLHRHGISKRLVLIKVSDCIMALSLVFYYALQ